MKFEKTITLTAYEVEYIDQRQAKPRTVYRDTVILDGGKLSALERLGMRPASYLTDQFAKDGYTVASVQRGETINANVDLREQWHKAKREIDLHRAASLQSGDSEQADETKNRFVFGAENPPRFTMTAMEAHKIADVTGFPDGVYDFLEDLMKLYQVKTSDDETWTWTLFMLSTAFVAGCVYRAGEGSAEH